MPARGRRRRIRTLLSVMVAAAAVDAAPGEGGGQRHADPQVDRRGGGRFALGLICWVQILKYGTIWSYVLVDKSVVKDMRKLIDALIEKVVKK